MLYHEFPSVSKFESLFRVQLANLIHDKLLLNSESQNNQIKSSDNSGDEYLHITSLLNQVENADEEFDLDIFNTIEIAESHLSMVTTSLNSMSDSMEDWTDKMVERTQEFTKINNIKDQRLRTSRQRAIINLLANELSDFNQMISNELSIYSDNFRKVGPSYANVILIAEKFNQSEVETVRESAHALRNSAEKSLESLAELLRSIMNLPPLNFNFNKAKREAELTIKNLTSETLEGLKLLNAALKD